VKSCTDDVADAGAMRSIASVCPEAVIVAVAPAIVGSAGETSCQTCSLPAFDVTRS
jgi:hypothetical protein